MLQKNLTKVGPLLIEKPELARYVTPFENKKVPIYRWYNYNHSFSRGLVLFLAKEFNLNGKDLVLDPFCGAGTTLLACKEIGVSALGIDILPLSVFVTNTKLSDFNLVNLRSTWVRFWKGFNVTQNIDVSGMTFLKKVFSDETLKKVMFSKQKILDIGEIATQNFLLLCLLSTLDKVSIARKDGGFLRFSRLKQPLPFREAFSLEFNLMLSNLTISPFGSKSGAWLACQGDSRCLPFDTDSFDTVITSPPYLNRHDYTRVYAAELLTGFLKDESELKELRYHSIRSHVEARRVFKADGFKPPTELDEILRHLSQTSLPNSQVVPMIRGYFEDIYLTLRELYRVAKEGARVNFVIGNVRYGGIMIPVDTLLAEIGNDIGFSLEKIIIARYKGNSPQQMRRFGKELSRESIIVWRK